MIASRYLAEKSSANYTCNNVFRRRSEGVHCALAFYSIAKLLVSVILTEKEQSGVRFPDASLRK